MTSTLETPRTTPSNEYGSEWDDLQSMLEQNDPAPIEAPEAQVPPRERAESRIGGWLRRLAERADSTSERIVAEKDIVRDNLISFGQSAKRIAERARDGVADASTAMVGAAKEVGMTTVGLGIMGAEKAVGAAQNQYNQGEIAGYQAATAALEFGRDKASQAREWLQQKRDAALSRRAARRAKWSARRNAIKTTGLEAVDFARTMATQAAETVADTGRTAIDRTRSAVTNTVERTRETIHVARAVGAAAIEGARQASSEAYAAHSEQNKL